MMPFFNKPASMFRLALLCLLLAPAAFGQEGTIHYDLTVKIEIDLPPEMEAMRDQIPTERTMQRVVHFDPSRSLTTTPPPDPDAEEERSRNGRIRFGMGGQSENRTFLDLDEGRVVERRDFLGRTFLIEDEIATLPWRITGEQSTFLNYICQKAVATRDSTEIEAWFTTQIPASVGPGEYNGLPGAILLVTVDGGRESYVATQVELAALAEGLLVPPTEGQRVTRDEFGEIMREKLAEMEQMNGGRGGLRIFRQ
jgi:GLPGLI family protein